MLDFDFKVWPKYLEMLHLATKTKTAQMLCVVEKNKFALQNYGCTSGINELSTIYVQIKSG